MNALEIATYLLLVLGLLGAADIAMYHSVAHGIRSHPDSRQELMVHSLRGPTYAALFLVIPNFTLHGAAFWLLMALLAVDVAVSIVDFAIERQSREFLGGLPSGEYVLHMVIAMVFGAMVTAIVLRAGRWGLEPTSMRYQPAQVPLLVRFLLAIMAVVVLYSGVQDALAVIRMRGMPTRSESTRAASR
jgi:hypothetical protein